MLLVSAALANHHEKTEGLSVPLKQTVGEGKNTHLVNRSLNKRSSDKSKSSWNLGLFGASNKSHRTEFDRRVDAYVERE